MWYMGACLFTASATMGWDVCGEHEVAHEGLVQRSRSGFCDLSVCSWRATLSRSISPFSRTVGKLWANIFATSKLEITSTHRGGAPKSEEMDQRGGGTAGKRKHDMSLISVLQCVNTRACTEYCTEKPSQEALACPRQQKIQRSHTPLLHTAGWEGAMGWYQRHKEIWTHNGHATCTALTQMTDDWLK